MSAKKSDTRIYTVSDGDADRLIRATSQAQALRHVARDVFKTRVATQDDIVDHLAAGGKVEIANEQMDIENGEPK